MKVTELNADLMRLFAYQATGNISPMQAVIGGIAAQEVMKVSKICCEYIPEWCVNILFQILLSDVWIFEISNRIK